MVVMHFQIEILRIKRLSNFAKFTQPVSVRAKNSTQNSKAMNFLQFWISKQLHIDAKV